MKKKIGTKFKNSFLSLCQFSSILKWFDLGLFYSGGY